MPVEELAAGLLSAVLRVIGAILSDVVLEIIIRGPGYLICRAFDKNIDADSVLVVVIGFAFWIVLAIAGYILFSQYL